MIVFPNAKINLGLHIVRKRDDGYHDIETVFYPIGLSDVLEILVDKGKEGVRIQQSGIEIPGNKDENLCVKAYHLLKKDFDLPALKIQLHKIVPIGAGLGGGSSDAAFFLKAVNTLLDLNLSFGELHHYAKQLGSDCSFFISNKAAFAEGRGDEMESCNVSLKDNFLVLVKPDIHISTQMAYAQVVPKIPLKSLEAQLLLPLKSWKDNLHNQFEDSVFKRFPELEKIKQKLYACGAEYAAMSGSGSSIFGIFSKEPLLKGQFQKHFVWQEKLK